MCACVPVCASVCLCVCVQISDLFFFPQEQVASRPASVPSFTSTTMTAAIASTANSSNRVQNGEQNKATALPHTHVQNRGWGGRGAGREGGGGGEKSKKVEGEQAGIGDVDRGDLSGGHSCRWIFQR